MKNRKLHKISHVKKVKKINNKNKKLKKKKHNEDLRIRSHDLENPPVCYLTVNLPLVSLNHSITLHFIKH